jgi:hypothetical protein
VEDTGISGGCHPDHPLLNTSIHALGRVDIQEDEPDNGIIDHNKNLFTPLKAIDVSFIG